MPDKKPSPEKTKQIPLQSYLAKPLPPFKRGSADCAAFVAGWVNHQAGKKLIHLKEITFGEAKRRALQMDTLGAETLEKLNWKPTENPNYGDIVFVDCEQALCDQAIAIFSEGKAITRMESESLFIVDEPKILKAWSPC